MKRIANAGTPFFTSDLTSKEYALSRESNRRRGCEPVALGFCFVAAAATRRALLLRLFVIAKEQSASAAAPSPTSPLVREKAARRPLCRQHGRSAHRLEGWGSVLRCSLTAKLFEDEHADQRHVHAPQRGQLIHSNDRCGDQADQAHEPKPLQVAAA
jgi:hypothetical protein